MESIGAVRGIMHIQCTMRNTIMSLTDKNGNVLAQETCGTAGFKNSRKREPAAAELVAENIAEKVGLFSL